MMTARPTPASPRRAARGLRVAPPVLIVLIVLIALVLSACVNPPPEATSRAVATRPAVALRPAHPDGPEDFHVQIPVDGVRDVMNAKLAHAQAVMEGLALEDFPQIAMNATALRDLSREAGWRVHTTVAYGVHSEEFRRIVTEMIGHAVDRKIEALTLDFIQMTQSCVRCHTYMRSEGLYRDVPGAVSMATPRVTR